MKTGLTLDGWALLILGLVVLILVMGFEFDNLFGN